MYTGIRPLLLIHPFISSFFFISHFQTKVFVALFSGTMRSTKLKLGTHVDNGLMYRIYWNQTAALLIHPFIHFSFQFSNIKSFCRTFLRNYEAYKVETRCTHGQRLDLANGQSDQVFLLTSKFCPQGVVCTCPRAIYMYIYTCQ